MPQHRIQVRVPFVDVDSSERIHFTAMMRYMELAEHELTRSLGFSYATTLAGAGFPRVHVSCDYIRAIGFDDELTIEARVSRVGNSSWTVVFDAYFTQELQEQGEDAAKPAAKSEMTIVSLDKKTGRATPLSDEFRKALSSD